VAVQERDGASGLWVAEVQTGAVAMEVARQAILPILRDSIEPPDMTCVARTGNVEFWRADFGKGSRMGGGASVIQYQWRRPEEMSDRNAWHRPHFESLGHFGVWSRGGVDSIFLTRRGPVLQSGGYFTSLQTTTEQFSLTDDIKLAVPTNGFLGGVLESVEDSDNNFFRNFSLDSNEVLCYQRPEDVWTRVCVPGASREAVLRTAHGDSVLPLPATKSGHTWIVTWVDRTSKMIVAAAAKEGQMSSEALALMTFWDICYRFGLPLHLTIDNDVKFVSSLWQSLWNLCGGNCDSRLVTILNPIPPNLQIDRSWRLYGQQWSRWFNTMSGMPPCRTLPLVSTCT